LDASHFDRLTRALATAPSRRGFSHALGGLLLATPFTVGRNAAGVEGKKKKRKKKKKCKGGKKKCGKKCFDLQIDPAHCGSCSAACAESKVCLGGACTCPVGEAACGGSCCAAASCIDDACCPTARTCGTICCDASRICGDAASETCVVGQGTCPPGTDSCAGAGIIPCNNNAECLCIKDTDGVTHCALGIDDPSNDCGLCDSAADCESLFPTVVGVFCAKEATGPCGCQPGENICAAPCPTT
jgi:hypothetical protein